MVISLKNEIKNVINEFNKYHGIEIQAKIVALSEKTLTITFKGSFCHTCGVSDYFEDFQFLLNKKIKINSSILSVNNISEDQFQVIYKLV